MRKLLLVIFTPFALHAMEIPQEVNNSKDFDINRVAQEVARVHAPKYEKIISNFIDQCPLTESLTKNQFECAKKIVLKPHFNVVLKKLLESGWLNPNAECKNGDKTYLLFTQLIYRPTRRPQNNIETFLAAGADPNVLCDYCSTCGWEHKYPMLNEAALTHCDYPLTELLLKYGADANKQFSGYPLPLVQLVNSYHESQNQAYVPFIALFVKHGADIDAKGDWKVDGTDCKTIRELFEKYDDQRFKDLVNHAQEKFPFINFKQRQKNCSIKSKEDFNIKELAQKVANHKAVQKINSVIEPGRFGKQLNAWQDCEVNKLCLKPQYYPLLEALLETKWLNPDSQCAEIDKTKIEIVYESLLDKALNLENYRLFDLFLKHGADPNKQPEPSKNPLPLIRLVNLYRTCTNPEMAKECLSLMALALKSGADPDMKNNIAIEIEEKSDKIHQGYFTARELAIRYEFDQVLSLFDAVKTKPSLIAK